MQRVSLNLPTERAPRLLCIGAHSDDIEIGCGGTILRLVSEYPDLRIHWVVLSSTPQRAEEARASAELFLRNVRQHEIVIQSFQDGFFPYIGAEIKRFFEQLKAVEPDLIFTHCRHDLHQDHRLTCELTWNTFRNHLILEYEIAKYDGDLGAPNCFVPLSEAICQTKIQILLEAFQSQRNKQWFSEDTFLALLRLRGIEANSPSKYAEAFYGRKMVL